MIRTDRGGAVRLLEEGDFDEKVVNPWNKPVVGWIPNSQGFGGLHNPMGFALLRVVVQRILDGNKEDLYDQPIIVEKPAAVVIAQLDDKIGFVQNYRFNAERIITVDPDYIRALNDEERWFELTEALGQWRWELPAGIAPTAHDARDIDQIIMAAAKLEASEEGGYEIENGRIVGTVNWNPTFFAHAQYIVHGMIKTQGQQQSEDLEILGATSLFTLEQVKQAIVAGEMDDGRSMSALFLAGFRLPV